MVKLYVLYLQPEHLVRFRVKFVLLLDTGPGQVFCYLILGQLWVGQVLFLVAYAILGLVQAGGLVFFFALCLGPAYTEKR